MIEATETDNEVVETTCTSCMVVPISHLSLEEGVSVPIGGWAATFESMNIKTVTDPAGRLAISTIAARRLLAATRRDAEWRAETAAANFERMYASNQVEPGGVPALEGATPYESMVAAERGIVTPSAEFGGGREKPRFLQDELEASERDLADKRRLATERKKERLADQMRDKLSGKP